MERGGETPLKALIGAGIVLGLVVLALPLLILNPLTPPTQLASPTSSTAGTIDNRTPPTLSETPQNQEGDFAVATLSEAGSSFVQGQGVFSSDGKAAEETSTITAAVGGGDHTLPSGDHPRSLDNTISRIIGGGCNVHHLQNPSTSYPRPNLP